jgi:DNA-binding NarL/FixJ family response regulator
MAIRVALGDDSIIVREGVRQLLAGDPGIDVVGAVGDVDSLRDVCTQAKPDVLVTDIRMPPTGTDEGIRLAAELRDEHPEVGVVVLSQFSDPVYALALLDRGSDGRAYLLKERVHNRAELTAAIRAVAAGGSLVDPKIVEALVHARTAAERSPVN